MMPPPYMFYPPPPMFRGGPRGRAIRGARGYPRGSFRGAPRGSYSRPYVPPSGSPHLAPGSEAEETHETGHENAEYDEAPLDHSGEQGEGDDSQSYDEDESDDVWRR